VGLSAVLSCVSVSTRWFSSTSVMCEISVMCEAAQ
jgi:hypothetical protein